MTDGEASRDPASGPGSFAPLVPRPRGDVAARDQRVDRPPAVVRCRWADGVGGAW